MSEFIRKLRLLFSGTPLPDYNAFLRLREKNDELVVRVDQQNEKLRAYRSIAVAGFDNLSHEPTDEKERIQYAARVSEFYQDILRAKIRTSISELRELLAGAGRPPEMQYHMTREQYDFFLRGMEAGLWKIHDWATILEGELKNK